MFRLKFYALLLAALIGLSFIYNFNQTARAQTSSPESEQIVPGCTANQVVTNGFDAGAGSLRQAVIDACAGGTITFSAAMPPTVSLSSGHILIDKNLTIAGPGAELMTIRNIAGAGPNNRIFNVNNFVTAAISGLTITDGSVTGVGGAIVNGNGSLTLADSIVTGNLAAAEGGGIYSFGTLNITGSLITENGGSDIEGVTLRGGGIYSSQGSVAITDSIVSFNNATDGGGIYIQGGPVASSLSFTRSSLIGNAAAKSVIGDDVGEGGGLYNKGVTTLTNSTVRGNLVGFCFPYPNNECPAGTSPGILRGGGSLTLTNSTVADFIGTTLDGAPDAGTFTLQNSIVAGSGAGFNLAAMPDGFISTPYGATLVPDRGAFTYSLMGGRLPTGLSLATNGSVVSVSGMTGQTGTFYFSLKRTDGTTTSVTDYSVRFYSAPASLPPGGCVSNPVVANRYALGAGTLAQAVADACAGSTITFGSTVVGKISTSLTINKNLTIAGPGADILKIRGLVINGGVTAAVSGLTISSRNSAGITNQGILTITDLKVSRNSGSGIYNSGNLTVANSLVAENGYQYLPNQLPRQNGGGIYNDGTLTLNGSTVSGNFVGATNSSSSGGGIYNYGTATITNSTVSGNRVRAMDAQGGGIFNFGTLSLVNSTIANNWIEADGSGFGGGVSNWSSVAVNARNSIIAGNTSAARPGTNGSAFAPDFEGILNSQGYNLIGNTDDTIITGDTTGNILGVNARLSPLGFYGGRTPTHALLSLSPAINAGNAAPAPATDQRGASRVGAADIGAFELNNSANGGAFVAQLPDGLVQNFYTYTLFSPLIGINQGSFTYSVSAGALPAGVSLSTDGTVVSLRGTPTASGVFNFSVTATNGTNSFVTNYRIHIQALPGGFLDFANCSSITGWAWDPQLPNTPISVNIYADEILIATVSANQFRQDLLDAGIGNGVHGFSLTTPANLKDGQPHQIRVRIVSTMFDLNESPKTITCALPSDLTVAKTHAGDFTQGDTGRTYSITVSNGGTGATSGAVSVADTLPGGLTATNIGGTGWNCNFSNLTCTRSDALAAGASYPAITLTVNVAANAPASVTNRAAVSGGGETNTANNTANDPTTINAAPRYSISGTVSYGNTNSGQPDSFVAGVNLSLTGAASTSILTDLAGNYQLPNLLGGNYTVTPTKTGDVRGINSLDATRIQQHLIGLTTLTPNQLIAADTDGSGSVNSLDATRIQQSLIGMQTANIIGQWKFAPANRQYTALGGNQTGQNYQAILVGEVSGNWATAASFADNPEAKAEEIPPATDAQTAERFSDNLLTTDIFADDLLGSIGVDAKQSPDSPSDESPDELLGVPTIQVSLPANASRSIGAVVTIPVTVGAIPAGSPLESFDFSVFYNPAVLQPASPAGSSAGTLSANCSVLSNSPVAGRVIVSGSCAQAITSGSGVLYNLTFTVVGAVNQTTSLSFINPANASNTFQFNNGAPAAATVNGQFIVLAPTAAGVSVSGRVSTGDGRGLMNASVTLTDSNGTTRTARTGSFGYFKFENVQAGQVYVFSVSSKRYTFAPQVVLVQEDVTELIFTPDGSGGELTVK